MALSKVKTNYPQTLKWENPLLTVYHGTSLDVAKTIASGGVSLSRCSPYSDFGRGFYTTTDQQQAWDWAFTLTQARIAAHPSPPWPLPPNMTEAVVRFDLDRNWLAELETLSFVRGDRNADDFWSLVVECRGHGADHNRWPTGRVAGVGQWYDQVVGPVTTFWRTRKIIQGCDQYSFHTDAALSGLPLGKVLPSPE